MKNTIKVAVALVVILLATLSGVGLSKWWHQRQTELPADIAALVLPQARAISPFHLVDKDGQAFTEQSLKGKWTFLFFGYTHCPDICPTTLAVMNAVAQSIETADGNLDQVQFVFVSVDPERDTPSQLRDYVGYFNTAFQGVTGERQQIDTLARDMSAMYFIEKKPGKAEYEVSHSSAIMLTEPSGQLRALFSAPHLPEQITQGFRSIRDHY